MMISAVNARSIADRSVKSVFDTPEFKYAMTYLEKEITDESKNGGFKISHGLCALCKDYHDYPSKLLRTALAEELRKNGYSYMEYSVMAPNGHYNSCFEVAW